MCGCVGVCVWLTVCLRVFVCCITFIFLRIVFLCRHVAASSPYTVGASPGALVSPLGANIGHRFLLFSGELQSPSTHLYLYSAPIVPPSNLIPTLTCKQPLISGDTGGLVLSILIGIATLTFVGLTWRKQRGGGGVAMYLDREDSDDVYKPYGRL